MEESLYHILLTAQVSIGDSLSKYGHSLGALDSLPLGLSVSVTLLLKLYDTERITFQVRQRLHARQRHRHDGFSVAQAKSTTFRSCNLATSPRLLVFASSTRPYQR